MAAVELLDTRKTDSKTLGPILFNEGTLDGSYEVIESIYKHQNLPTACSWHFNTGFLSSLHIITAIFPALRPQVRDHTCQASLIYKVTGPAGQSIFAGGLRVLAASLEVDHREVAIKEMFIH